MSREFFDIFKNLDSVYLDSASTTQKPQCVIDSINSFYLKYCANVHRGNSKISNRATMEYESVRKRASKFINAPDVKSIIFTKGLTESINFVANSVKDKFNTIIISSLEHHSNIIPWHIQNKTLYNGLEVVNCDENLNFDFTHFEELLKKHPSSFVSITHISNAFGVVYDIKKITTLAHKYDCLVCVDGAQSAPHIKIDVQELDVDFYAISSHKMYGPMGVGLLYIKENHLPWIKLYQVGGGIVDKVSFSKSTFMSSPLCYEAGTPNISGVVGFGEAMRFIDKIGYENIKQIEITLKEYLLKELNKIENIIFYTDNTKSIGSISFNIKNISNYDIGTLLDSQKIAIRYGSHCAQPAMDIIKSDGTLRVSIGMYNNKEDIDKFIIALKKAIKMLS